MEVHSSAFDNNGFLPGKYAKQTIGDNISPAVSWSGKPETTKSFALRMIDESAHGFVHWEILNIPTNIHFLEEGASKNMQVPGDELANSFGGIGYAGPQPPPGSGRHRYKISVYALNVERLEPFFDGPLEDYMENKVLASADLYCFFEIQRGQEAEAA